jgi:hypothetical protein
MLPEDGRGTQERERVEKEREKLSVMFVTFLELHFAAGRWNGYAGERVEKEREKLSVVFVTFRVTVCCQKIELVRRREREWRKREKLSVVLVTLCHADGRWNRLQKRER